MPYSLALFFASWYDPSENGFDVGDALDLCLVVAAIYGFIKLMFGVVRWADARKDKRHRIDVEAIMKPHLDALDQRLVTQTETLTAAIAMATLPIQPLENGGLSLSDAHVTLNRIEGKVDDAVVRLAAVEDQQTAASAERATILRIGATNAKAITDAITTLGAEIELLPFAPPDASH